MNDRPTTKDLHASRRPFLLMLLGVAVAIALFTFAAIRAIQVGHDNTMLAQANRALALQVAANQQRTTQALCALRGDLQQRAFAVEQQIRSSQKFLRQHPHGIPGIPASLIRQGIRDMRAVIAGEQRTIAALSIVNCPTESKT